MTVYYDTLPLDYLEVTNPPSAVIRNITAADSIVLTINTASSGDGGNWTRVLSSVTGCTLTPTTGLNGTVTTITPSAGATSYAVIFRTSAEAGFWYGRISGTISAGGGTPTYSVSNASTNEGASATATVTTTNVANGTTLYWTVNATTADVSTTSGSFTINSNTGSFSIPAIADSLTEGTETYTISVRTDSTAGTVVATSTLTINDTSTTPAGPTYSVSNASTNEGASATVNVTTTNVANGTTLYWTVNATTADVSTTSGSFTINSNAGSFTIPAIADATTEGTEAYTISVRTGSTSGTVVATSTLTINDTSQTPTTYTLTFYDASFVQKTTFNEGESLYVFVNTNAPNGTYYWNTSSDSDLAAPVNGSFLVDTGFGSIYCTLAADSITEGTETLTFNIRSGSVSGTILASSSITVLDTSTAPVTPTYSVGNASTNEGASATVNVTTTNVANGTTLYWTVNATTADVSTTSGSFTINSNAGSFTIPAIADSTTEGTETYTISVRTGSTAGTVVATSILTINDTSTTPGPDTTPDAFTFTDLTNVGLSSVITSNTITVSGISADATISISGGTYSIDGGAYTGSTGSVSNGQTVTVQHTSSASYSTATNTILTIGGVSDTFTSTTIASGSIDTTPDAFSFTNVSNASLNAYYTNNTTITGLQPNYPITVTASGGTVDGATALGGFSGVYSTSKTITTSATGTMLVSARVLSSSTTGTTTTCTITIGGVSGTFSATTYAAGTRPDQFTFVDQTNVAPNTTITSNTITVAGLTVGTTATVSVTGGSFSKNGGAFVTTSGVTVTNGDTLRIQCLSSSYYNSLASASMTLTGSSGSVADSFSVKTSEFLYSMNPFYMYLYEGREIVITAKSTQTINGTLYWTIDGATTADFNAVSGSVIMNNGVGTFTLGVKTDAVVEGVETYTVSLRTGSTSGTVVSTSTLRITEPPASTDYGFQLLDEKGNIVLDTSSYTVKDTKYSVEVTSATTLSVPSINNNTVAQVIPLSGADDENTVEGVSIDYTNKLLVVTGSAFLAEIVLLDYR